METDDTILCKEVRECLQAEDKILILWRVRNRDREREREQKQVPEGVPPIADVLTTRKGETGWRVRGVNQRRAHR